MILWWKTDIYKEWDKTSDKLVKTKWWHKRTEELQVFADVGDVKSYFRALKMVYGPRHGPSTLLYSKGGIAILKSLEDT